MSKGSQGSATTTSGPPAYLQPYYSNLASAGANLYQNNAPLYYPGNQVAPFSPLQEQGFGQIQGTASQPNTIGQTGQGYFNALESGSLLNPATNPSLQGMAQLSDNQIMNNLSSEFAGSGRNIEASAPIQANQMSNVAANIYGGAYNNTLNNMTGALGQANPLTQQMYMPGQELLNAGGQIQNQAQNMIGANQNLYNYYAQLPWTNLSNYMNQVNAMQHGGTQTNTQPYFQNQMGNALGGAATGAALGSAAAGASDGAIGGPMGMAIGGGLGLLAGYFG